MGQGMATEDCNSRVYQTDWGTSDDVANGLLATPPGEAKGNSGGGWADICSVIGLCLTNSAELTMSISTWCICGGKERVSYVIIDRELEVCGRFAGGTSICKNGD